MSNSNPGIYLDHSFSPGFVSFISLHKGQANTNNKDAKKKKAAIPVARPARRRKRKGPSAAIRIPQG